MSDVGGLHPDKAYRDETGESRSSDQDKMEELIVETRIQVKSLKKKRQVGTISVTMSVGIPTSVGTA